MFIADEGEPTSAIMSFPSFNDALIKRLTKGCSVGRKEDDFGIDKAD